MSEIQLLQGNLQASRDAWGRALKQQEGAETALKTLAAKRASLDGRHEAAGVRVKALRTQIVTGMFESEDLHSKQIAALVQAECEFSLLSEAVAGIARRTVNSARQVVLDAKVAVSEAALAAHEAQLALHSEQVKEQLRGLQSTVGSFEVTGLGSVAESLAHEVLSLEKAVHKARRDAEVHAAQITTLREAA